MTKRVAIPYNYLVICLLSLNYFANCPLSQKPLTGPLKGHRFYRFPIAKRSQISYKERSRVKTCNETLRVPDIER